jgi:hypothetical protein
MSDQDIIHFIYIILPLKEQFERDPYGLTQTELQMLNDHHCRSVQRRSRTDLLSKLANLLEPCRQRTTDEYHERNVITPLK